jgi:alpha-glucosidase
LGRDPERTPMQWDDGPHAGFTTGTPWLPLADDFRQVNVACERDDPASMLALCRRLIELRRTEPALTIGAWRLGPTTDHVLSYWRTHQQRELAVALNLGSADEQITWAGRGRVLLSTQFDRPAEMIHDQFVLRPNEGLIIERIA